MTPFVPLKRDEPLLAWRITRAEFTDSALTGQGGLYAAGRWHRAGQPVVYLASNWSLAALEVFVHLGRCDSAIPFIHLSLSIPTDVPALLLPHEALPSDWTREPPSPGTQALGTDWLRSGASVLLKVPSALSPAQSDYNWVLNPLHPDAARLIASEPAPENRESSYPGPGSHSGKNHPRRCLAGAISCC